MSEKNKLVVIKHYIKDIRYKTPTKADELTKRTVTEIKNAVGAGIVDSNGMVWFDSKKLNSIIRVRTKKDAAFLLEQVDDKYKSNFNNNIYVRWSEVVSLVARRIDINPKNEYLGLVFDILKEINASNDVKVLQGDAKIARDKNIRKLKKKRIKVFKIIKDELTNERLNNKEAEFSHIRSVTMFPEYSEFLWNGLIVNKETHNIITREIINDEEELYRLCYEKDWNTEWYESYKVKVENM